MILFIIFALLLAVGFCIGMMVWYKINLCEKRLNINESISCDYREEMDALNEKFNELHLAQNQTMDLLDIITQTNTKPTKEDVENDKIEESELCTAEFCPIPKRYLVEEIEDAIETDSVLVSENDVSKNSE